MERGDVPKIVANACRWAAPVNGPKGIFGKAEPLEEGS